ncbi:hypothetical protein JR316_0005568 [Psilocybe cubensis]|uniref:Uncharacterized protein n=2 Tax=Psilocybe cubensis TaxID=181762 RepID=A0ACB8H008_PSICU|nr:hypothetical protein JR316_0005568 [Psilocybe cubensis]KAH9481049.1 hypothetical protein JR316_0005568 [Psilocybe cubensis]
MAASVTTILSLVDEGDRPFVIDLLQGIATPGDDFEPLDQRYIILPSFRTFDFVAGLIRAEYKACTTLTRVLALRLLGDGGDIAVAPVKQLCRELEGLYLVDRVAQTFGMAWKVDVAHIAILSDCFERIEMSPRRDVQAAGRDCVDQYIKVLDAKQRQDVLGRQHDYRTSIIEVHRQYLLMDPGDALGRARAAVADAHRLLAANTPGQDNTNADAPAEDRPLEEMTEAVRQRIRLVQIRRLYPPAYHEVLHNHAEGEVFSRRLYHAPPIDEAALAAEEEEERAAREAMNEE